MGASLHGISIEATSGNGGISIRIIILFYRYNHGRVIINLGLYTTAMNHKCVGFFGRRGWCIVFYISLLIPLPCNNNIGWCWFVLWNVIGWFPLQIGLAARVCLLWVGCTTTSMVVSFTTAGSPTISWTLICSGYQINMSQFWSPLLNAWCREVPYPVHCIYPPDLPLQWFTSVKWYLRYTSFAVRSLLGKPYFWFGMYIMYATLMLLLLIGMRDSLCLICAKAFCKVLVVLSSFKMSTSNWWSLAFLSAWEILSVKLLCC